MEMKLWQVPLLIIAVIAALLLVLGVSIRHTAFYVVILLILALPFAAIALLIRWALRRRTSG